MPMSPLSHEHLRELRRRASVHLKGEADESDSLAASDALAVLHDLAASPGTAADALALLHELQVHQIELELQADELRESRAELETMLHRQIVLYDHQPVGCFTVDDGLVVQELNLPGAAMLGLPRDDAFGLRIDGFLSDDSAAALRRLMAGTESGPLELALRRSPQRKVLAQINADPQRGHSLMTWTSIA